MPVETIYMPLLNENVPVWCPVDAEALGEQRYRILGPMPETDEWAFGPGTVVAVRLTKVSGGSEILAAYEISN